MIMKDFEHVYIFQIRDSVLVIYRDGEPVAEFEQDLFPHIIEMLAQQLKYPCEI